MSQSNIQAIEIVAGKNTFIHPTAVIRGIDGPAKRIIIGDNCYIGENVQIICNDFSLGDYSKIQHHTNIHGYLPCAIGHNAWIGQYSILDSIGGMSIGNNCGIGAHSQLWSHIKYGDTLEGSRFLSEKKMQVGNDVWFVGHCIVSPVIAEDKSMAMAGSVITKNMKYNRIYAGAPAYDISDKVGGQFIERSIDEKFAILKQYLCDFGTCKSIKIVMTKDEVDFSDHYTYFVVADRCYKKRLSDEEIAFMKFLLPAKAKYTPY